MIRIREAARPDNDGLLLLTSMAPMAGEISIRIDRHPDFFRLLSRRGQYHVLVAEKDGEIVGCVSATRYRARVNGEPEFVYYLGDLKVRPDVRRTGLALRMLTVMHRRLLAAGADLVVSTAAQGNRSVWPLFAGLAELPRATALGLFRVYQIIPSRRWRNTTPYSIGEEFDSPDLYRLYNDYLGRYQFSPYFEEGSLRDSRHWVARSGGEIVAAIALSDVGEAKQNVLIGLPFLLEGLVSLLRAVRRVAPIANLPRKNEPIRILYIKALAFRPGHEASLNRLIQKSRNLCFDLNYSFLAIGVHERDPLGKLLRKYPKFTFKSKGFVIGLKREKAEMLRLMRLVPYEDYSLV